MTGPLYQEFSTAKVMAIDDDPVTLKIKRHQFFQAGCPFFYGFSDAFEALERAEVIRPDVILVDLHMPGMNGFSIVEKFAAEFETYESVPVVVLSEDMSDESRLQALNLGAADFVSKSADFGELFLRVRNALRTSLLYRQVLRQKEWLSQLLDRRTIELRDARKDILERLAIATEYRDDQTGGHTRRVAEIARLITIELGESLHFCNALGSAALLHDVGKIGIPDALLLKPGRLTQDEFELVKDHTMIGAAILNGCDHISLRMAREIALTHHERWDGTGYPSKLKGDDIPLSGRIVCVADAYDAMTTNRPYQQARTPSAALAEIQRNSGTQFDPRIVEAFARTMGDCGELAA